MRVANKAARASSGPAQHPLQMWAIVVDVQSAFHIERKCSMDSVSTSSPGTGSASSSRRPRRRPATLLLRACTSGSGTPLK
eukprot:3891206-Lingulodinium_polyedra.AAC.1